jgi:hypothetical protein
MPFIYYPPPIPPHTNTHKPRVGQSRQRAQLHRLRGAQRPTCRVQNQLPRAELGQGLGLANRAEPSRLLLGGMRYEKE